MIVMPISSTRTTYIKLCDSNIIDIEFSLSFIIFRLVKLNTELKKNIILLINYGDLFMS